MRAIVSGAACGSRCGESSAGAVRSIVTVNADAIGVAGSGVATSAAPVGLVANGAGHAPGGAASGGGVAASGAVPLPP